METSYPWRFRHTSTLHSQNRIYLCTHRPYLPAHITTTLTPLLNIRLEGGLARFHEFVEQSKPAPDWTNVPARGPPHSAGAMDGLSSKICEWN